jgi:hypothetical protein
LNATKGTTIRILWLEGMKGSEIYGLMLMTLLSQREVYEWMQKLKGGLTTAVGVLPGTAIDCRRSLRFRGRWINVSGQQRNQHLKRASESKEAEIQWPYIQQ